MNTPPVVSPAEWEAARQQLLVKEKELTRARDALAAERRRLPWQAVEKDYEFDAGIRASVSSAQTSTTERNPRRARQRGRL
jgi:predicted dithiol-disulfide oxidoreductase (DUF899 family)